jgi:hypothetical protein
MQLRVTRESAAETSDTRTRTHAHSKMRMRSRKHPFVRYSDESQHTSVDKKNRKATSRELRHSSLPQVRVDVDGDNVSMIVVTSFMVRAFTIYSAEMDAKTRKGAASRRTNDMFSNFALNILNFFYLNLP